LICTTLKEKLLNANNINSSLNWEIDNLNKKLKIIDNEKNTLARINKDLIDGNKLSTDDQA